MWERVGAAGLVPPVEWDWPPGKRPSLAQSDPHHVPDHGVQLRSVEKLPLTHNPSLYALSVALCALRIRELTKHLVPH